jgi:two-component system response regulator FixJ
MAKRKRTTLVAIVDDDAGLRAAIEALLNSNGFRARSFPSAEAFLQCVGGAEVGCLILDYRLPGMSGLELQRELQAQGRVIPIIFATADNDDACRMLQSEAGALAVLHKPFDPEELTRLVTVALEGRRRR